MRGQVGVESKEKRQRTQSAQHVFVCGAQTSVYSTDRRAGALQSCHHQSEGRSEKCAGRPSSFRRVATAEQCPGGAPQLESPAGVCSWRQIRTPVGV